MLHVGFVGGGTAVVEDESAQRCLQKLRDFCEELVDGSSSKEAFIKDVNKLFPKLGAKEAENFADVVDSLRSKLRMDDSHIYMNDGQDDVAICILADSPENVEKERRKLTFEVAEKAMELQRKKSHPFLSIQ